LTRTLVIANPFSGNAKRRLGAAQASALVADLGHTVTLHLTAGPGDATAAARDGAGRYDLVVAVGGDGTVHETALGLVGTGCPLGVLPSGSGNDFATGIGCGTVAAGLAALARGEDRPVDAFAIDDHVFVNSLGLLASGLVSNRAAGLWRWLGPLRYSLAAVGTLLGYRGQDIHWEWEGPTGADSVAGRFFFAEICNGPLTGGGFRFAPDARWDDGLLDACLIRPVGPAAGLRLLPAAARGDRLEHEAISLVPCSGLAFEAPDQVAFHVDGEAGYLAAGRHEVRRLDEKLNVRFGAGKAA
jgi:YegS/Rv2252/BmrU family lipid kinase